MEKLNNFSQVELQENLSRCCGSSKWVNLMMKRAPFATKEILFQTSSEVDAMLTTEDWKEAFAAHPRIGRNKEKQPKSWEAKEQESTKYASNDLLSELEEYNDKYYAKFGFIFIVCATGKSAEEMLGLLKTRISYDLPSEIRCAAAEQSKITKLRLEKLLLNE